MLHCVLPIQLAGVMQRYAMEYNKMTNFIAIGIQAIISLLRVIFFPLKIVVFFLYPDMRRITVGYAWYSRDDYRQIIETSLDDEEGLVPTYDLWKARADEAKEYYSKKGYLFIKVQVRPKELEKWLLANSLPNICENREKYVNSRLKHFLENGIT